VRSSEQCVHGSNACVRRVAIELRNPCFAQARGARPKTPVRLVYTFFTSTSLCFGSLKGSCSISVIAYESVAKARDTVGASSCIYFTRVAARECASITEQSST
jgi:hypothetical protein